MMEFDQTATTNSTAFGVVEETYRKHNHQYPNQSYYNWSAGAYLTSSENVGSNTAYLGYTPYSHQNAHYLPPQNNQHYHSYPAAHYQSSQYSTYMTTYPTNLVSTSQTENMYWNSTNSSSSISTSTTSQSAPNPSEYTFGVARNYPLSSSSSSTVDSTAGVYRSLPKHQRRPNKRQERVRKRRILFSQAQIHGLEQSFKSNQYLTSPKREILARTLNLTKKQVTIWFQNNRYKLKKSR